MIIRKEKTTANSGFALWGLTCFLETFVQGSTFVLRMNSSAKNPHNAKPQNVVCNIFSELTLKASLLFFPKEIY